MDSPPFRFAISATFTAEPLEPVIRFWERKLGANFEVRFAGYNQVQQTLAQLSSEFNVNRHGMNVVLARLEDLGEASRREENFRALVAAVEAAREHSPVPLVLHVCPPAPSFVSPLQVEQVADYALEQGEKLGRIPYTDLYFCALGTAIVRYADALTRAPFKVIALDCDNTLWRGICGEDEDVVPDTALQQFMVKQHEAGMLLVMASKNNEQDVLDVFARHPEMPLQLRHFAAWRLNWDSKAVNLRSMAEELSLGLDSFLFVDDNPKETAEVAESVPEVAVLTLPLDLEQVWAFDHVSVTDEDRKRNASVEQARDFGRELKQAASLKHFLDTLELRLTFGEATPERLPRIAQLTQRTNQFNFTGVRRTEAELARADLECLTVEVSDRFGDYGLTGAVLYRVSGGELTIDTFVLSCRVLGRGVEHRVMARLGSEALSRGATLVKLPFIETAKNVPAKQFWESLGGSTLDARNLVALHP